MGALSTLSPAVIKAFESYLGLPQDGTWDPELEKRVGSYQALLGQTPGQTDTPEQYAQLVSTLQGRSAAFSAGDAVSAQDPAFQAFMRESGAQESELLDEIRYRTEQNSREINRRAAGFAAQKEELQTNANMAKEQGTKQIAADFSNRGLVGASEQGVQTGQLINKIDVGAQQDIAGVDEQQMQFNAGQNDALSEARRRLLADANSLYRRRADEELNARSRIAQRQAEQAYGNY